MPEQEGAPRHVVFIVGTDPLTLSVRASHLLSSWKVVPEVLQGPPSAPQETLLPAAHELVVTCRDDPRGRPHYQAALVSGAFVEVLFPSLEVLAGAENLPLMGKKILVGRPAEQSLETALQVKARGGRPIVIPLVELTFDLAALVSAFQTLSTFDVVILTSRNAVNAFFSAMSLAKLDLRAFGGKKFAVVGSATAAELAKHHLYPEVVAEDHQGDALGEELVRSLEGSAKTILFPRATVAREVLPDLLRKAGHEVEVVSVYRSSALSPDNRARLAEQFELEIDVVLLTASSLVDALVDTIAKDKLASVTLASIGPVTTARCRFHGLTPALEASPHTVPALLEGVARLFTLTR